MAATKAKPKIKGLTSEKCEKRNRIAARRESVEAVPIRFVVTDDDFLSQEQSLRTSLRYGDDFDWHETAGEMPTSVDEALRAINALLPEGADRLTADDVFIHYIESANSNFIGDRYMFLGESTLRNIATDAAKGVAFMNSHRTGSYSTESELPLGKTFAGQYQAGADSMGRKRQRCMIGFYMLKGIKPNGENGPTTDDIDKMIRGGQLADVSVGLSQGESVCDVCKSPYNDCPHVAGTRRAMTDEQIEAQQGRAVPGGKASYTLEKGRLNEVSGVYDGAVPGAGVKKVLAHKKELSRAEWLEAKQAFGSLLSGGPMIDESLFEHVTEAVKTGVREALSEHSAEQFASAVSSEAEAEETTASQGDEPMAVEAKETVVQAAAVLQVPDNSAELAAMQERLKAQEEAFKAQEEKLAKLQADKEEAEKKAESTAAEVAKLQAEARKKRFSDEVKGLTLTNGTPWAGEHEKHIAFMESLAASHGEESEQFKFYVETQRAVAAQLKDSALFKEIGTSHDAAASGSGAWEQIEAKAGALQTQNPSLSKQQAIDLACDQNKELYAQYLKEEGRA